MTEDTANRLDLTGWPASPDGTVFPSPKLGLIDSDHSAWFYMGSRNHNSDPRWEPQPQDGTWLDAR